MRRKLEITQCFEVRFEMVAISLNKPLTDKFNMSEQPDAQITSKQIIDDAFNRSNSSSFVRPKQTIQDLEELHAYQQTKRKEYEQQLNKNRLNFGQWIRYARWELEHNHDFARARSIMERALDVNVEYIPFWTQYIQWELIGKNANHARNLLERATTTLPNVSKLWYLYAQTEEMLKNYLGVRSVFERWLRWRPDEHAWDAYIRFETRYEEVENARLLFKRYVHAFPHVTTWQKWIDYELENNANDIAIIRAVFEAAILDCLMHPSAKQLVDNIAFAKLAALWLKWELKCQELERTKSIRQFLLQDARLRNSTQIQNELLISINEYENIAGDKTSIEASVLEKRKAKYLADVTNDPTNYDSWWSYISILVQENKTEEVRDLFQKIATLHQPHDEYKSDKWRKYIMIWMRYALWEEFDNRDIDEARRIWNDSVKLLASASKNTFTSGKLWIAFAKFELRSDPENGLVKARKVLGRALGHMNKCGPKTNVLRYYIELEKTLCEWDRVRSIYQKWVELALLFGADCTSVFKEYLHFELSLEEDARCEALLDTAMNLCKDESTLESLNRSEITQLAVTYYTDNLKFDKVRDIHRSMVTENPTVTNWVKLALLESTIPTATQLEELLQGEDELELSIGPAQIENTREVYREAETFFKNFSFDNNNNSNSNHDTTGSSMESRRAILESWREYEEVNGDEESIAEVVQKLPKRIKKRKNVNGIEEEYYEYVFPDNTNKTGLAPSSPSAAPTATSATTSAITSTSISSSSAPPASINKFLENAKKWAAQSS